VRVVRRTEPSPALPAPPRGAARFRGSPVRTVLVTSTHEELAMQIIHRLRSPWPHTFSALLLLLVFARASHAAGMLTAKGSPDQPIRIKDHHVAVTIDNGFARTEV